MSLFDLSRITSFHLPKERASRDASDHPRTRLLAAALASTLLAQSPLAAAAESVSPDSITIVTREHRQALAAAVEMAGLPTEVSESCFVGQFGGTLGARMMASTVLLAVVAADEESVLTMGSGVIIAGSDPGDLRGNRILTAGHVASDFSAEAGEKMVVFTSWGEAIGEAQVAAVAADVDVEDEVFLHDRLTRIDTAVLKMHVWYDHGKDLFTSLPGLKLATEQASHVIRMEQPEPFVPQTGASGGPLLNVHGEVIGVFSAIETLHDVPTVRHEALTVTQMGDLEVNGAAGHTSVVSYPEDGVMRVSPVASRATLAALGAAGRAVSIGDFEPQVSHGLGFPQGQCMSFKGMAVLDAHMPAADYEDVGLDAGKNASFLSPLSQFKSRLVEKRSATLSRDVEASPATQE